MPEVQNLQEYSSSVLANIYAVQFHILEELIHFATVISFNTDLRKWKQSSLKAPVNVNQP